jgi:hypothetical protein
MIDLTRHQQTLLRAAIEAGDQGLPFRAVRKARDYGMGDALGLVVSGLLSADEREERLYVTERGRNFMNRSAFA